MKIPMPLNADKIAKLTGSDRYANEYRYVTRAWQLKGSGLTNILFKLLYRLDLTNTEPDNIPTVRVLNSVKKIVCPIKIKEVNFYPLKSELEIITSE